MISIPFCREFEDSLICRDIDEKPSVCVHKGAVSFGELLPDGIVFFGMQISNVRSFATSTKAEIFRLFLSLTKRTIRAYFRKNNNQKLSSRQWDQTNCVGVFRRLDVIHILKNKRHWSVLPVAWPWKMNKIDQNCWNFLYFHGPKVVTRSNQYTWRIKNTWSISLVWKRCINPHILSCLSTITFGGLALPPILLSGTWKGTSYSKRWYEEPLEPTARMRPFLCDAFQHFDPFERAKNYFNQTNPNGCSRGPHPTFHQKRFTRTELFLFTV